MPRMRQADFVDGLIDPAPALAVRQRGLVLEVQAERDIAFQRQPRQEAGILERDGHARMHARQWRPLHL
ncbi:hypothetical protein D3C71_2089250 [compost metagenome]